MSFGKIYSYPNNWRVKRVLAVAALSGVTIEEVAQDMAKTKTPDYQRKFPLGTVPAFESADGVYLTESLAIAEYVARATKSPLLPSDKKLAAEVAEWNSIVDQEIAKELAFANRMFGNMLPYNKATFTAQIANVVRKLDYINSYLASRTFLVGDRLSTADIALASALVVPFSGQLDAAVRAKIPHVVRHFETVTRNPKIASIYGQITYSETAPQYQAPKKDTPAKPAKEKAPAAPKAEKAPKAPKKKEADEEEEEPLVPAEPKAKNPLDDLPKSDFKMDDWKRTYSNEDTKTGAIPWFYQNYDKEGYSVWRVDYKYNDELTQVFMSSNLIGGFFARLEGSRKYTFASMGVFGVNNDSVISGVILARGQEIEPVVSVAPDWESYKYTRLDLAKPEDKEFFEGALMWELSVDGKPFADGKIYK